MLPFFLNHLTFTRWLQHGCDFTHKPNINATYRTQRKSSLRFIWLLASGCVIVSNSGRKPRSHGIHSITLRALYKVHCIRSIFCTCLWRWLIDWLHRLWELTCIWYVRLFTRVGCAVVFSDLRVSLQKYLFILRCWWRLGSNGEPFE